MLYVEPWWLAFFQFRTRRTVEIEDSNVQFLNQAIPILKIANIETRNLGFPLSLLDIFQIDIEYKKQLFTAIGFENEINKIATNLRAKLAYKLSKVIATYDEKLSQVEEEKNKTYVDLSYVRYSLALEFSEYSKSPFQEIESVTKRILSHPLLSIKERTQAKDILNRINALRIFVDDQESARHIHNKIYLDHYRLQEAEYFKNVESSELTKEQITSSLVFEDATLVVAAAGSGKSSCIVGKIGFALKIGLFKDDEILALAYNRDAATSLNSRLNKKLSKSLKREINVAAKTFHSFGLTTMVDHHGESYRPKVLKEEGEEEGRFLKEVIANLFDNDTVFQSALAEWLMVSPYDDPQPVGTSDSLEDCARRYEECCRERIRARRDSDRNWYEPTIPTFDQKKQVRSLQERGIANWLIMHDINFEYEAADYDGAKRLGIPLTKSGKQKPYNPDFTYQVQTFNDSGVLTTTRIVHEHFALDANGNAPKWIGGKAYVEQANQKRKMYQIWMKERPRNGKRISFFETHSADFYNGSIFSKLQKELESLGIKVGPIREDIRELSLKSFRESGELEQLIIDFVLRYKDSGKPKAEVFDDAKKSPQPYRALLFLRVAFQVFDAYQTKLNDDGRIDFSDMLREAISILNTAPKPATPYRFVLVDEFQDISRLKADLVKAVLAHSPRTSILFCVGDDWQTINRFSGSDVSIFTGIGEYFKRYVEPLELSITFRCAQGIANVSRSSVMLNKGQTEKDVISKNPQTHHTVRIVEHGNLSEDRRRTLEEQLQHILNEASTLKIKNPTVFILRRTKKDTTTPEGLDTKYLQSLQKIYENRLNITMPTMHGSKGSEADFVILPGLDSGFRGFPDERPTEWLMDLVLPKLADPVEEERRLFYVGLTRAKHKAIILTNSIQPSEFILELESQHDDSSTIEWISHEEKRIPCPKCKKGSLIFPNVKLTKRVCSRQSLCGHREK